MGERELMSHTLLRKGPAASAGRLGGQGQAWKERELRRLPWGPDGVPGTRLTMGATHMCMGPTGRGAGGDVKGESRRNRTDASWTSGPTSRLNGAAPHEVGDRAKEEVFRGRQVELRIPVWDKLGLAGP